MFNYIILYPYKMGSKSCQALQRELEERFIRVLRVYPDGNYRPRTRDLIINWGNGHNPNWQHTIPNTSKFLNKPEYVNLAINKLHTFIRLSTNENEPMCIPDFTTNKEIALGWRNPTKGHQPCGLARLTLIASEGRGIRIFDHDSTDIPDAPLYVKYIPKKREFRVYMVYDKVIFILEKRKMNGFEGDPYIRNHHNGWRFCHVEENLPDTLSQQLRELSVKGLRALGLNFGGIDIIYNEKQDKCYLLEINTAPGIEGSSVVKFADAFEHIRNGDEGWN